MKKNNIDTLLLIRGDMDLPGAVQTACDTVDTDQHLCSVGTARSAVQAESAIVATWD